MITQKKIFRALSRISLLGSLMLYSQTAGYFQNVAPSLATSPIQTTGTVVQDAELYNQLSARINANPLWKVLVAKKKMAVGLVDLRDETLAKYASVNGNHMMYAASLPKIAVLLAAMDAIDCGDLEETAAVKADMRAMIAKSNNQATTRMIDRVGFERIEQVLTSSEYGFYDEDNGGGLWVGKRYAAGGRRYPDPLKGISHAATVNQVCRFYTMLAKRQLISTERSDQMMRIMGNPELHHKFVNTLDKIAPKAKVYRKSGSWRTYHSDSALVVGPNGRRYVLVALIDDPAGGQICKELVYAAEEVLGISSAASSVLKKK